jgi:predicted DNA-binding transcriptional regulator AlpA
MPHNNHTDIGLDSLDAHRVISEAAAAHLLSLSVDTLQRLARQGRAPHRIKLSPRRVGYRLSDCIAWLQERSA